jgi:GxxExxY protein
MEPRIHTNRHELIFADEVFKIVGHSMDILNKIGYGFFEKIYENALVVALERTNIPYQQQKRFEITYLDKKVGEYIPDLIVHDKIIVDIKTIDRITDRERGQLLNYLKVANLNLALILNFKHARLEWERIVFRVYSWLIPILGER